MIVIVIVATSSPDRAFPSAAADVQGAIGAKHAVAFDITAACSGFIFGIEVCLEMIGTERIDTLGEKYADCDGVKKDRENKLHMVFKNTYQIRSQGSPV